jgi:DNA modification methylase
MKPELLHGDTLNLMTSMREGSVDLIVTDPPYPVQKGGNKNPNAPTGILDENDGKIMKHNDIDVSDYASELYRVLRDPGHIYVFTNVLNIFRMRDEFVNVGFKVHNILTWVKRNATPNRWYMHNRELILFMRKGKAFPINHKGSKASISCPGVSAEEKLHVTQKPVSLLTEFILNSSLSGETVFDPFMGCGSTGRAALSCDRKFIGHEIDVEYFVKATMNVT